MPEIISDPDILDTAPDQATFDAMRTGRYEKPDADPEKPAKDPAAPPDEESTDGKAKAAPDPAPDEEQEENPDKPKGKGGFQRRIDKLTAKVHDLERQLAGKPAEQPNPAEPGRPPSPRLGDFDTIDAYETARDAYTEKLTEWKLAEAERVRESKSAEQRKQQEADTFAERVRKAETKYSDFQEVAFSDEVTYSKAMVNTITALEEGAEVAYFLGKNPAEAERISRLPDTLAVVEIGKIIGKIISQPAKPKPVASKAPPPSGPLGVSAPVKAAADPYDEAYWKDRPYDEWERARVAHLKKLGR